MQQLQPERDTESCSAAGLPHGDLWFGANLPCSRRFKSIETPISWPATPTVDTALQEAQPGREHSLAYGQCDTTAVQECQATPQKRECPFIKLDLLLA